MIIKKKKNEGGTDYHYHECYDLSNITDPKALQEFFSYSAKGCEIVGVSDRMPINRKIVYYYEWGSPDERNHKEWMWHTYSPETAALGVVDVDRKVRISELIELAKDMVAGDGHNDEYDRAMLELITCAAHLPQDDRTAVAILIGTDDFIGPKCKVTI